MDYVNFGSVGLKVSPIAVGLGLRGQADESHAQRMIEHALDSGINLIDCANVYGTLDVRENAGQSEIILGRVLKNRRDRVVITSKVASRMGPGPNDEGLSRGHIMREVENSLERLGTDYIDVYLVHTFDESTRLEETISALSLAQHPSPSSRRSRPHVPTDIDYQEWPLISPIRLIYGCLVRIGCRRRSRTTFCIR